MALNSNTGGAGVRFAQVVDASLNGASVRNGQVAALRPVLATEGIAMPWFWKYCQNDTAADDTMVASALSLEYSSDLGARADAQHVGRILANGRLILARFFELTAGDMIASQIDP
ncbi:hypothetical protein AK812_SmicGene47430, partial [Symbiodinium microadriaticum]